MASRLARVNAVTVNDVLDGRKLLEIDCVDRVYLTLSVPSLVVGGQVVNFLTVHERNPIPSPVLLERRGLAFRRAVASFAEANDISMRQVEVAKTITFTAPRHARAFFEALAADNLDIGRPDNMEIIFNRQVRCVTKGVFRTAVDRDNDGVVINAFYRHSRVKTYLKDGRALRVETVINDAVHRRPAPPGTLRRADRQGP